MQRLARERIIIEKVTPQVDGGRYPVKRVVGDLLHVEADIFRDGHDVLAAVLKVRPANKRKWSETPMRLVDNDRWAGEFPLTEVTSYFFTIEAWTDAFESWRRDLRKRVEAQQDVSGELLEGIRLIELAAQRAKGKDRKALLDIAKRVRDTPEQTAAVALALDESLAERVTLYPDRGGASIHEREYEVVVDRVQARYAAWYEMFPRSQGTTPGASGTFRDCIRRLPELQEMGFDVIYLPPIHPIGRTHRKGKNNALTAAPDDPGCPWAIGNELGGHKSIEPSLGALKDFEALVDAAGDHGMEVALDFAIQCSPDHPYVKQHPEWFHHRPDGTIKYAENPPKKYQDIYPLNFDSEAWPALWQEMKSILLFWIGHGVKTFRVDNPHTKPVRFWEWLIRELKRDHPDVILLSEAFTRPKMMKVLAKVGFTQSYTYFTWRNTKAELTEYLTELTQSEMVEYFRGNLFANTPDILHAYLQTGGRPAFKVRLVLAASLSSLYGIYSGYELCENVPVQEGSEEYLNSEKYEIKVRDWDQPGNLKDFITIVNRIRRENPALQLHDNLRFHVCANDQILCYSKATPDFANAVIVVVNLDPHQPQEGWVELDLPKLGLAPDQAFEVQDQLTSVSYGWRGARNYVRLDPQREPAHLLIIKK